jgi:hypothetical protein
MRLRPGSTRQRTKPARGGVQTKIDAYLGQKGSSASWLSAKLQNATGILFDPVIRGQFRQ